MKISFLFCCITDLLNVSKKLIYWEMNEGGIRMCCVLHFARDETIYIGGSHSKYQEFTGPSRIISEDLIV